MNKDRELLKNMLVKEAYFMINKKLVRLFGIHAALFIADLISKEEYFAIRNKTQDNEWFYNTIKNREEDTRLSDFQQRNIIKKLIDVKILKVKLKGIPARTYFKINHPQIIKFLNGTFSSQEIKELSIQEIKELDTEKINYYKDNKNKDNNNKHKNNNDTKVSMETLGKVSKGITNNVFKSKYAEKVISYQNKIADKIKGLPHVRITKRNPSIEELELYFKLLKGNTFLQNNSINSISRKINNIPFKDEIEFNYKKHINRLSLLYKGEYEPRKKSILPKSLLRLIYNPKSEISWLMQVMYNSPKKVSDRQVKDNHPEITKFFIDKFNGTVINQNKLVLGIRSIVNFTKHIPKKTLKVSKLRRDFGEPLSLCENYYDWLEHQNWIDEIESIQINANGKLWKMFIKEVEEEDCDGYKLQ